MLVYDVRDVVKCYPGRTEPANRGISLEVAEGEVLGLLGDNGAGKTTLVRQMVNLLRSRRGQHPPLRAGRRRRSPARGHERRLHAAGEARRSTTSRSTRRIYYTAHLRGLSRRGQRP